MSGPPTSASSWTTCSSAYDDLQARGAVFNGPPVTLTDGDLAGSQWAYLRDPDGIQLEIWQYAKPAASYERGAQTRMRSGFSIRSTIAASNCAPTAPSITRWSAESVTVITVPTTS